MRKLFIVSLFFISIIALSQTKGDVSTKNNTNVKKAVIEENQKESETKKAEAAKKKTIPVNELTEQEFEIKLKDLETDVNILKEKIFRSKARLSTLQETLISGKSIQSAKLIIKHVNKFSHFNVKSIIYYLDGEQLWAFVDIDGNLTKLKEKTLYDKVVVPGIHMLSVVVKLEISELGLFNYAKGYQFQIKANRSFHIQEGTVATISVELKEKGGYFNDITDKPDIVFRAGIAKELTIDNINKNKKK